MKALKTIATGLGATMLATTMLAGAANAAPKPQIEFNTPMVAPKANIIKPIRPNIARPLVKVRVNRDRLQPKAGQDDDSAGNASAPAALPHSKAVIAALVPPQRLPQPRPEFEDQANDIKDMIGADGIGDINPDDFRVGVNPHDPDGALAGLGLPGANDEPGNEFGNNSGPSGPAGGVPGGSGSPWDNAEPGIGDVANPIGGNSHGKDAPETAPGVRVTPGSIAGIVDGVTSYDTGWVDDSDLVPGRSHREHSERRSDGGRTIVHEVIYPNGNMSIASTKFRADGSTASENYRLYSPNGTVLAERHRVYRPNEIEEELIFGDTGSEKPGSDTSSDNKPGKDFTKLYDPDYVGGGYVPPNCGSHDCNRERQRQANPGLQFKEWSAGANHVLTDAEHSAAGPTNGGTPIVSRTDLVSRYDPDYTGNGEPTPIDKPRIQSD